MQYVIGLRCLRCGTAFDAEPGRYVCGCRPNIGSDLGTLDVLYDYAAIAADWSPNAILSTLPRSLERFEPFLPIASVADLPRLPVGDTPLLAAPRLAARLGLRHLWVKDDGRNPTGSLKDRASAIAVARAQAEGACVVATASTGNAAAALAGMSASAGMRSVIFVPETAPRAKLAQLLVYGSTVLAIRGTYDQAFDLCTEACDAFGWYNRNTGLNPYMSEGKKTVSFEITAQLNEHPDARQNGEHPAYRSPDVVAVSVGDGCIIGGVYKGFYDLLQVGWIDRIPRIIGIQSEGSAALANAWSAGLELPEPVNASTRADSISVNAPRDAAKALRAVRASGGAFVTVSDDAILGAVASLAREAAVFAEPAGAAALAGLEQALDKGLVKRDELVVLINTGSGLKDVQAAIDVTGGVRSVDATMDAVRTEIAAHTGAQ